MGDPITPADDVQGSFLYSAPSSDLQIDNTDYLFAVIAK
ncbi:MAG: hypothetical protein ACJAZP_003630 [Psychromonas sp.]|jgi:hypothetical protein